MRLNGKELPLVWVKWRDSNCADGWQGADSALAGKVSDCITVGYLMRQTNDLVQVCCTYSPGENINGEVGSVWVFPAECVKSVTPINIKQGAKPSRKRKASKKR